MAIGDAGMTRVIGHASRSRQPSKPQICCANGMAGTFGDNFDDAQRSFRHGVGYARRLARSPPTNF